MGGARETVPGDRRRALNDINDDFLSEFYSYNEPVSPFGQKVVEHDSELVQKRQTHLKLSNQLFRLPRSRLFLRIFLKFDHELTCVSGPFASALTPKGISLAGSSIFERDC